MITEGFIEELKYASGIESVISSYVDIKHRGRNLQGLCPFHSEKSPSFTVYPETQSFYCFGCGTGGDVITFIRQIENLDYREAIELLARRAGLAVPESAQENNTGQLKKRILELNREVAKYFYDQLMGQYGIEARQYLIERGLSSKTIRTFGIGYAPDGWQTTLDYLKTKGFTQQEVIESTLAIKGRNDSVYDMFRDRIMFPIIDIRGNVIGFGGRLMEGKGPKYLNTPDTPVFKKSKNLFALNFAKASEKDTLLLGEGYMDVIAMHQANFTNSVATLGTSLTAEQSRLISQYASKVIIAYDADHAGQAAAQRAINLFAEVGVGVTVLQMEGAKDPDEYIKKFGALRFQSLLDGGKSAMDFEIDKLKMNHDMTSADGKLSFLDDFCRLMSGVNNSLQRDIYIGGIAKELEVGKERIVTTVENLRKRNYRTEQKKSSKSLATSVSTSLGTDERPNRYRDNISGLIAEENLITMLMLHPDYYKYIGITLTPEDFSDQGYAEIYKALAYRLAHALPIDLIHFSEELSPALMGKLSQLVVKGHSLKYASSQIEEYVTAIKKEKKKKSAKEVADMLPEEYREYMTALKADKK